MLKPPKNRRRIVPRTCGTCRYLVSNGINLPWCRRDGTQFADDLNFTICDRYEAAATVLTLFKQYV